MSNLVFSEYIPSCIFFFSVNNEGYSAKDCKLFAQIAPALVTCDHLENADVSVMGSWFCCMVSGLEEGHKHLGRVWALQKCWGSSF